MAPNVGAVHKNWCFASLIARLGGVVDLILRTATRQYVPPPEEQRCPLGRVATDDDAEKCSLGRGAPQMDITDLHPWDVAPDEARRWQDLLRRQVSLVDGVDPAAITSVAGVDNAYVQEDGGTIAHAAAVRLTFPDLAPIETAYAAVPIEFPYVPGLLSFREAPAILAALRGLTGEPDVILFDGQGIAHFRRIGLASHLGVVLDRPTIGCAKTRLVGRYDEPADEFGAHTPLIDRGEEVGAAVRTRLGRAPLFVSPGHRMSVATAVAIVLRCCRDGRFLPEPTRLAHDLVTEQAQERRRRLKAASPSRPPQVE
jgi:deoxyribonuclease V